jgi:hypothetical protein
MLCQFNVDCVKKLDKGKEKINEKETKTERENK